MKKIVTVVGARPQFIKTPLLSKELRKSFREVIVHTGQHYDANMSDVFFDELNIPKPDYNLGIGSAPRDEQISQMKEKIETVLTQENPDLILIYGDTNSTLAAAEVGKKLNIPIAHVEAGMRSYNQEMPEEINRIGSDQVSSLLFCSTQSAVENLKKEGITNGVHWVGDVMNDIFQMQILNSKSEIRNKFQIQNEKYILATIHRQSNTDSKENLTNIIEAFNNIDRIIVWPLHPRTKKYLDEYGLKLSSNIKVIEPQGYKEMIELEANAQMILTDSGGVQKEAYLSKVPCITLREETEWIETVNVGWNKLAGADKEKILSLVKNFTKPAEHPELFGDGQAYKKIVSIIKEYLAN